MIVIPVVGFPDYKISDTGIVFGKNGKPLKPYLEKHGYMRVNLRKDGRVYKKLVHRLVAEAFIPNPRGVEQVNHRDENRVNNDACNLEWVTRKENMNYGTFQTRKSERQKKRVINLDTGQVFDSINEARKSLNITGVHIGDACTGKAKTCGGFHWSFI